MLTNGSLTFHPTHRFLIIFLEFLETFIFNRIYFNLQNSYALNFHIDVQWKGLDRHATLPCQSAFSMGSTKAPHSRSRRLDVAPISAINFIHRSKVIHVREEDVHLDHLVNRGTGAFQYRGQVLDALMLKFPVSDERHGCSVEMAS